MNIADGVVEKDVELEMLMVDGHLEGILEEFEQGNNVRYRIFSDGKPVAMLIPFEEYKKARDILGLAC